MKTKLNMFLDNDLIEILNKLAQEQGRSRSNLINWLLRQQVEEIQFWEKNTERLRIEAENKQSKNANQ